MEDNSNKLLLYLGIFGSISSILSILIYLNEENLMHLLIAIALLVVGGIFGYYLQQYLARKNAAKLSKSKIFKTAANSKYNYEFYKYFLEKIKNAKHDIYITGEGFECKDDKGKRIARNFINAHREALNKGVNIVRLQTKGFVSNEWSKMLKSLLEDYPNNFKLYVTENFTDSNPIASICTIDDADDEKNVVEFMFSVKRNIGDTDAELAGLAFFIENDKELCNDFKNKVLEEIKKEKTTKRVTTENYERLLTNKVLYFSYGSNMDEKQMKSRCSSAIKISNGYITDHKLVFNRKGSYREGGVASIEPSARNKAWGVIYQLSEEDFTELDRIEDPNAYIRKEMEVMTEDEEFRCEVYLAIPQGEIEPDKEYLELIIKASKRAKLPKEYIKTLEEFREMNTGQNTA